MQLPSFFSGIRGKLIGIFVLIKVVPLVLLAWFAWHAASQLGEEVSSKAGDMSEAMLATVNSVGKTVTDDSIRALDLRSREAIESVTTEVARQIAAFLYDRDQDILAAAALDPSEAGYRQFLSQHKRTLYRHGPWKLADDGKSWMPEVAVNREANVSRPVLKDNAKDFHIRPPEYLGEAEKRPLFVEISFIDLNGQEKVKATQGRLTDPALKNVADRKQTFVRAESYFSQLSKLKPGEIYVSEVIGAYVPTQLIGPYLPETLKKAGKPFAPETSAYAGTENPVGKRFRGIVRWATPVVKDGKIAGYVTLALDHDHIRQFSDRVMPTEERYTPIADAIKGNYAFIWDHKSRNISHPRDYFIVGYDPESGLPATPWMDEALYTEWQQSGKAAHEFLAGVPPFREQNLQRKAAAALTKAGTVGLDCRYLNFSPQCDGWNALTEHGGSGSFVIFFSGLWKLTTAAAIPYYTGQYAQSRQGFGFVTIGANVDDFHQAANETARKISTLVAERDAAHKRQRSEMLDGVRQSLANTAFGLASSTALMVVIVIAIAFWMANFLTRRITGIIQGIQDFKQGSLERRLDATAKDEMGELARSFNGMADSVAESFKRLEESRAKAEEASRLKSEFLANMSHELRTPLNGILGFAELLQNEVADPVHKEYTGIIRESGNHLLDLVNQILDLSKVESGSMEFHWQETAWQELIEHLVSLHRVPAENKGLQLMLETGENLPESLETDPTRLRQILNNLLSNAVKFTEQGAIHVSVRQEGDYFAFAVSDTGPGIPVEAQALVFEKFKQLEHFLTRSHSGSGLGLALVKQLTEHMGGSVKLESAVGVGSTFTVYLPCRSPHE